jgi:hypothetical protein
MALHNWTDLPGWEGVHLYWMTGLGRWLKGQLPAGYRAVVGASPMVGIDLPIGKPDVAVQNTPLPPTGVLPPTAPGAVVIGIDEMQPDVETAVAVLPEDSSVMVEHAGRLVAVVEMVSPRNKDRPSARVHYATRYMSYLKNGVHFLLVDVHPRPIDFGFGTLIAAEMGIAPPPFPAPQAISYRVGEPAAEGGRLLGVWQRALTADQPLPSLPLGLLGQQLIVLDLESTYRQAAMDAYVD